MAIFSYHTIASPTEGLYKDRGSKFMAFAYPVLSEEEIKNKIEVLKKEYFGAHHYCFAWTLGAERKSFRAYDDGEPNHSAGDPILGQIRSKALTNVLVVVVRYFGGVKLGVGGLVTAYKAAAEDALNKAVIVERAVIHTVNLIYDYSATPEIMRLVKELDLIITDQRFEDKCEMVFCVALREKEKLVERLAMFQVTGINVTFSFAE